MITNIAHGELGTSPAESGVVPSPGFVAALGVRLREMWKLANRVSGESAAMEAAIQVGEWVARGLALPVLEAIRTEVFNVSAPAGP